MADEEHGEIGESTTPDAETVGTEDEPHADTEPLAIKEEGKEKGETEEEKEAEEEEDAEEEEEAEEEAEEEKEEDEPVDVVVPENIGEDEEEQEEQADVPEDVPPETVDEPQPDAVETDESGAIPPEPESSMVPMEEDGAPEGEMHQQLDSTEAEVVIPAVTDEETIAVESTEPQEVAASPTDEALLEVVDDAYKREDAVIDQPFGTEDVVDDAHEDTVIDQPFDREDDGMGVDELDEDLPQSAEQLPDEPSEVMPYPSADTIDVIEEDTQKLIPDFDELAELDEGDEPDPTRVTERVGPVQECPEVPLPPPLLVEGPDDIQTPKDESKVPSVLVCFSEPFYIGIFYCNKFWYIFICNSNMISYYRAKLEPGVPVWY